MPLFCDDNDIRVFKTPCGPFDNNAYLIVCPQSRESVIIDAPQNPENILEEIEGTQVKAILITHSHLDHLAGLKQIANVTGAPVYVHAQEASHLPVPPSHYLKDGDTLLVGTVQVQVLHTPGHTPGSVCFLVGKHLFSGDTLFPGGPGRTSSPEALRQVIKSIVEKLFPLPDDTSLLPGHGQHSTLGASREEYNVFAQRSHPADLSGDVLWLRS